MGWKERIQIGSFRGVPFLIDAADSDFGRRVVTHEFPQRDLPFVEDLGRKARKFVVECYVLGDDYLTQRDSLLAALEKKGSGPLVHPYFGRITANVDSVKVRDSSSETRIARFQISFIESGETIIPVAVNDTVAAVKARSISTRSKLKTAFTAVYDFAGLPYAQTQGVLTGLQQASNAIRDAQGAVNKVSAFAKNLQDIGAALGQIVLDAELLADSFMDLIGFGFIDEDQNADDIPDLRQSFQGLTGLYEYASDITAPSDASEAFDQLVNLAALTTTAAIAAQIDFTSQDEAQEYRDKILGQLDTMMESEISDDVYSELADLRAAVEEDITGRSGTLARLVSYQSPVALPALVIANQLYGNIDQEADIIARNRVRHPGFVSGTGVEIKVLSSAT